MPRPLTPRALRPSLEVTYGRSSETPSTGGTSIAKRSWELGESRSSGRMRSGVHAPFSIVRRSTTVVTKDDEVL
jgi:hypothetical protein